MGVAILQDKLNLPPEAKTGGLGMKTGGLSNLCKLNHTF